MITGVTSCYIYIHLHTSTYIMLHLHTSCYIYIHHVTSTYIMLHLHTSTYIYIHLHTSTYIYHISTSTFFFKQLWGYRCSHPCIRGHPLCSRPCIRPGAKPRPACAGNPRNLHETTRFPWDFRWILMKKHEKLDSCEISHEKTGEKIDLCEISEMTFRYISWRF